MAVQEPLLLPLRADDPEDETQEELNPFFNLTARTPCALREKAKRAVVCIALLPIRILCILVIALLWIALAKIATIGLTSADLDPLTGKPLAGWRRAIFETMLSARWLMLWSLGFFGVHVKGKQASQAEAPIIVSNHVCGMIEGIYFLGCATMAEAHYVHNPIFGPVLMGTSSIFVDRADPQSRSAAKQALKRRASETRWPQTLVFPEGTCTNGSALVQFKQGAFAAGCPVQPVIFRYPNRHHDVSFTFPVTSLGYILGMLMQFRNRMEVEFLDVYVPSEVEKANPAMFASAVQTRMANALGVPATKHAAEDVALCLQAQRMKMPLETGIVQWQHIQENLTDISVADAKRVLKEFRKLDRTRKGKICLEDFVIAMRALQEGSNVDASTSLRDEDLKCIFQLLDTSGDGLVDFREYFCGVAVLRGHGKDEDEALEWTFDCLSHGETHFTKGQLTGIISRAIPTINPAELDVLFFEADTDNDGLVSREEFIAFAKKHQQLQPKAMLNGLPLRLRLGTADSVGSN